MRFLRVDHAGVVGRRYNLRQDAQPLARFLWHFEHASAEQRGIDTNVRWVMSEEVTLAQELNKWKPEKFRPWLVVKVPIKDEGHRRVIVRTALTEDSHIGRATRAYPAYDLILKSVVFMKDSWRSGAVSIEE